MIVIVPSIFAACDRYRTEYFCGLAVALFEQIGERILRNTAHSGCNEIDDQDANPGAGRKPQLGQTGAKCQAGGAEQAAGADPGANQGRDQHVHRHIATSNDKVVRGFDAAALVNTDAEQNQHIDDHDNCIRHLQPLICRWVTQWARAGALYLWIFAHQPGSFSAAAAKVS